MICSKCKTPNDVTAKVCKNCGSALSTSDSKPNAAATEQIPNQFQFEKSKMIGYLTYLKILNQVEVSPESIVVKRKANPLGFIKGKEKATVLQRSEITNIQLSKKLDLIDGIYVVLFGILTLISLISNFFSDDPNWILTLILLAVAGICFLTGYGRIITISRKLGKPVLIQSADKNIAESFMEAVK